MERKPLNSCGTYGWFAGVPNWQTKDSCTLPRSWFSKLETADKGQTYAFFDTEAEAVEALKRAWDRLTDEQRAKLADYNPYEVG